MPGSNPFELLLAALRVLARASGAESASLAPTLLESSIDLHPHQIEAAVFALTRRFGRGAILADEVGLGKTIEAGLVIAQRRAEGAERILVLVPASLRLQWCAELQRFFGIQARLVDARSCRRARGRLSSLGVQVASIDYFAGDAVPAELRDADWDLVVIDEAHRLRNVWRPGAKRARRLRERLRGKRKLLLTATPLQNSLLELFGLVSLVDERLLGSEAGFRARFLADERGLEARRPEDLRGRLATVLHRTLRRQVMDSIRFTARRSLLYDFEPSPAERELYGLVSDWLQTSRVIGLAFGNRTLLVLAYRKILASSTFAIAATLRRLVATLTARLEGRIDESALDLALEIDGLEDEQELFSEASGEGGEPRIGASEIAEEIARLKSFLRLADSIAVNAKAVRLVAALREVFAAARERGHPEKAVVFTESRRTQDYLRELLERSGWAGRVTLYHGGSGDAFERDARVSEFRASSQILLATEAGAEGLNLQFCNIVVNYDLPWNPQRIEQRIGRCHRYGQTLDVLVINFLNSANEADRRLHELLGSKLSLFDGVFGSSDDVLGALESGVDFERRVLDIYQTCRTPEEIDRAFDVLRGDMEALSAERLREVRSNLLDHFDDEVRAVLERRRALLASSLDDAERDVRALVLGSALKAEAETGGQLFRVEFAPELVRKLSGAQIPERLRFSPGRPGTVLGPRHPLVRELALGVVAREGPPAVHELVIPASGALARLRGRRGYWFLERVAIEGLESAVGLVEAAVLEGAPGELGDEELESLRAGGSEHRGYSALEPPAAVGSVAEAALAAAVRARAEGCRLAAEQALAEERARLAHDAGEAEEESAARLERGRQVADRARERVMELAQKAGSGALAIREAKGIAELLDGQFRHEQRLAADDRRRRDQEAAARLEELGRRLETRVRRVAVGRARFWLV